MGSDEIERDRLAKIGAEGFAMIDELYGRPGRRPRRNNGYGSYAYTSQGPPPLPPPQPHVSQPLPPHYNHYPHHQPQGQGQGYNSNNYQQVLLPMMMRNQQVLPEPPKKHGVFMIYKNQQGAY
uniref:Uncharacterized protein n=1 Tax=Cannabis sativa TaxID=3483 RepID=A0A803R7J7_CANSA